MNAWSKIFIVFIATALAAWPVASMQIYTDASESSFDTCVASWSGFLPDLSADSLNAAKQTKSSEEVFCGHFMSVEDIPSDNSATDFVPAPPIFTLQPFWLFGSLTEHQTMPIMSEHAPHSLNPEVAPHPPKYC